MDVKYEDATKMFDKVDAPPSGSDLADMNFKMVAAMKSAPTRRVLRQAPTQEETADFAAMDTLAAEESDELSTDMTQDKALNEIWNNGGDGVEQESDAAGRNAVETEAKKVRKLVGMCLRECPSTKQGMGFYHDKKTNVCYKCKSDC